MKNMRKGKKMLIILLIAIIIIIAAVLIIKNVVNQGEEKPGTIDGTQVIQLPEITYSNMEVKNIQMEYLRNNNETMVSMEIHNTTENKVEKEYLDAVLIGADEEVLGQTTTYIKNLDVGEQYNISVILDGDLTATTRINLIKK